jgi:hypothetical protein
MVLRERNAAKTTLDHAASPRFTLIALRALQTLAIHSQRDPPTN